MNCFVIPAFEVRIANLEVELALFIQDVVVLGSRAQFGDENFLTVRSTFIIDFARQLKVVH